MREKIILVCEECLSRNYSTTKNKTLEAIKIVNEKFSKRFSIDLIAGYPGDTIENLDNSINEILKTKVDHISLYSLCIEEGTEVYKKINSNEVDYDQDYYDIEIHVTTFKEDGSANIFISENDTKIEEGIYKYSICVHTYDGAISTLITGELEILEGVHHGEWYWKLKFNSN